MKIIKFLLSFLPFFSVLAQENIPVGTWRTHYSYEKTSLVLHTNTKIFASYPQGMASFDPEDNSLSKLTELNGLNDASVSAMAFDAENERLLLGYNNGNVDLITADEIVNIPNLLNSGTTESKTINHISFQKDQAYLSTGFGLLVLDLTELSISDAFQNLGEAGEIIEIWQSSILDNEIYLASPEGILKGVLSESINLQDFNNWERFDGSEVFQKRFLSVVASNGQQFAATASEVYKNEDVDWSDLSFVLASGEVILNLKPSLNGVFVITNLAVYEINSIDEVVLLDFDGVGVINDVIQVGETEFWLATETQGLIHYKDGLAEEYLLNGPRGASFRGAKVQEEQVVLFPTLAKDLSGDLNNGLGVSVFSEGKWTVLTSDSLGGLSNISDLLRYDDNTLYASFGSGVYDAAKETIFNQANSVLEETDDTDMKVLVSGLVEDRDRKVWISAFGDYSLYCIDREDEWQRFDLGLSAAEEPYTLQINERNQLWMRLGLEGSKGILAYDIDDAESRLITTSDGLPSNQVNDIAFGKDGEIWIATAKGIVYFPFAFGIIEDNSVGVVKPVFEGAFLFEDKEVTAVAIDGGDRKWIGGKEGLWLFEDNIESEVAHFTTENSPLPSNTIVDISIDPLTGEVFVVTDNGVLSYRSDASEGLVKHQEVDIYPNPVRPNYSGLVGFAGLVDDGVLKITTVSGRLVREINANGGAASWDVADYNGRRVNTGVYLVYSSNSDGTETYVGKIAVVN